MMFQRKITSLSVLLLLIWGKGLSGQNLSYFSTAGILHLQENHTSRSIFTHPDSLYLPSGIRGLPSPTRFASRNFGSYAHAILEFGQPLSLTESQKIDSAFAAHFPVLSTNPGFLIEGDLRVWLTHHIAYKPGPAFDPDVFQALALSQSGIWPEPSPTGIQRLWVTDLSKVIPLANSLWLTGMFDWCQPDFAVEPVRMSDPLLPNQFYLDNQGQNVLGPSMAGVDINVLQAWMLTTGSPLVKVAVVDDGVEAHEDLEDGLGASRVLPGYSTFAPAALGAPVANEFHGQPCAGIVAASHNTLGVRGVAPQVRILPVAFPYDLTTPASELADALNWAWMNGADVISNAWAVPTCLQAPFATLVQAVADAESLGRMGQGAVVVFAAGNSGLSCVYFPGNMLTTLSAGAVSQTGTRPAYGNHGPLLDLVSPTSDAVNNVYVIDRMGPAGINVNGGGDLPNINYSRQFGGTSTATSTVSGVAALLLSEAPWLYAADVRDILRNSATDMGAPGYDTLFGFGRLNAYAALLEIGPLPADRLALSAIAEGRAVKLNWQPWPTARGDEGYAVEAWENGDFTDLRLNIRPESGGYTATDHTPSGPVRLYRLRITTPEGKSFFSEHAEARIYIPEGNLTAWLQPGGRALHISAPGLARFEILDAMGSIQTQQLVDPRNSAWEWDTHQLPAGIYLLRGVFLDGTGQVARFRKY